MIRGTSFLALYMERGVRRTGITWALLMCPLLSLPWTYCELLPVAFPELIPMNMEICGVLTEWASIYLTDSLSPVEHGEIFLLNMNLWLFTAISAF